MSLYDLKRENGALEYVVLKLKNFNDSDLFFTRSNIIVALRVVLVQKPVLDLYLRRSTIPKLYEMLFLIKFWML